MAMTIPVTTDLPRVSVNKSFFLEGLKFPPVPLDGTKFLDGNLNFSPATGGGAGTLSEVLAAGNTTGNNNIVMTGTGTIQSSPGVGIKLIDAVGWGIMLQSTSDLTLIAPTIVAAFNGLAFSDNFQNQMFQIDGLAGNRFWQLGWDSVGNWSHFYFSDTDKKGWMDCTITHDFKLGINKNPDVELDVAGRGQFSITVISDFFQSINNDGLEIQGDNRSSIQLGNNPGVSVIGDTEEGGDHTVITINDPNRKISMEAINGIDISGAINEYADNAAAVSAVGAGTLYYTNIAGEYIIKLSH